MGKKPLKIWNGIDLTPQSSDPANPQEGWIFYADGTSRAKGIWRYGDGAWTQVGGAVGAGGGGGELASLEYNVSLRDTFGDNPASAESPIDIAAGKTDSNIYDLLQAYYRMAYDATKTASTTGTAVVMSAAPSFTVKAGDVLIYGDKVIRIGAVTDQTNYTLDAAFSSDLSADAVTVSQCVHTKELNGFTANGTEVAPSTQFTGDVDEAMICYSDSETSEDIVPDWGSVAHVAFSLSADTTNWSDKQARTQYLYQEKIQTTAPVADSMLYIRFFANKTSGSGFVNLLEMKAFWHRDLGQVDGENYVTAFARIDTSDFINCSHSVAGGKSRIILDDAYPVGLNPTDPSGSALEVYADGKLVPRYIDGSLVDTSGAYFKEINASTIELDSDYTGAGIDFQIKVPRLIIDTSTQNTTRITDIEEFSKEAFQDFVALDYIDVPNTVIENRSQVVNFANDLRPRMGVERMTLQKIYKLQDEFGANGEDVFKAFNDPFNQVRFVGSWIEGWNVYGVRPQSNATDDYMEITFYGTGLNILYSYNAGADLRATVDGGAEGSNIIPAAFTTTPLGGRGYAANVVIPVVEGLSEDVHTVKLRHANTTSITIYGLEFINEVTALKVPTGTAFVNRKKVSHNSLESISYNSGFESGTLGTKGGRVLTYLKSDGTIGKAVTNIGAAGYLGTTDHSNEEVVRKHNFREFGANRSDDFSTLATVNSDRAFTLDDGTTTLIGNDVAIGGSPDQLSIASDGGYVELTFVGTGLDVRTYWNGTNTYQVFVDQNYRGNIGGTNLGQYRTVELCSGLPYGTHKVRILRNSGYSLTMSDFIVYQPKTPELPAGAMAKSTYNIAADFVANTVANTLAVSQGVIRKANMREFMYAGTWATPALSVTTSITGWIAYTATVTDYVEYTFFGTGFDFRFLGNTDGDTATQMTLDGSTDFSSYTTSYYGDGGGSFTAATGILDQATSGSNIPCGVTVSGLSLGVHKIRIARGNNTMRVGSLDVITPIHNIEENEESNLQNTLTVGNQSIGDLRKFSALKEEIVKASNWFKAIGIASSPTTSSTVYVPVPDLNGVVRTNGEPLIINARMSAKNVSANVAIECILFIDGEYVNPSHWNTSTTYANIYYTQTINTIVPVGPGVHHVQLLWKVQGGTGQTPYNIRELNAREKR